MRVGLAAQDQPKEISCPQCFEINPAGSTFCQLCGAPLSEKGEAVEGSDTEVYRDLAQTNLLRMRGSYKEAIQVCLSILKRYPHNVTAHSLLGDIHAEQGDLEQAAEWYEMALDLSPQAEAERQKLDMIRRQILERETAATDQQLEIPESKPPKTGLFVALSVALILICGVAAYAIGNMAKPKPETPQVNITTGGETNPTTGSTITELPNGSDPDTAHADPSGATKTAGEAILDVMKSTCREKSRYISVVEDARGPSLIVSVRASADDVPEEVAALVADDIFTLFSKYVKVTVRVMVDNSPKLHADAAKAKVLEVREKLNANETMAAHWQEILTDMVKDGQPVEPPPATAGDTTGEAPPSTTGADSATSNNSE